MMLFTWKHRLWICLSHVGNASCTAHTHTSPAASAAFTLRHLASQLTLQTYFNYPSNISRDLSDNAMKTRQVLNGRQVISGKKYKHFTQVVTLKLFISPMHTNMYLYQQCLHVNLLLSQSQTEKTTQQAMTSFVSDEVPSVAVEWQTGRNRPINSKQRDTFKVNDGVDLINAAVESSLCDHLRSYLLCLNKSTYPTTAISLQLTSVLIPHSVILIVDL